MSESSQQDATVDTGESASKDLILELSFVPKWAQRPPANLHPDSDTAERAPREPRESRHNAMPSGRPGGGRGRPSGPPRGDFRKSADASSKPRYRVEPAPPPPVDIRFYPDQKAISELARQIQQLKRAFPLMDLASIFTAKPETCCVRIEVAPGAGAFSLYQCKKCGLVTVDKAGALSHILKDHFADYFDKEDVVVDPPTGQFSCVARCGLSGVLLGPPNHHSHAAKVQEIIATRFPSMTLDTYSGQIKILKDPQLIEQWKEESRHRTVYKLKSASGDEPKSAMSYVDAESWLSRNVAPELAQATRRAVMSVALVRRMDASPLLFAIKDAWQRECRFPGEILFALRGALRGRKLLMFKVGHGKDFVTAIHPSALDPNRAVQPIKDVLIYLHAHPGCRRKELLEALRPGKTPDTPEAAEVLQPLTWLVEKGHIIEFFDGTLSVPLAERKPHPVPTAGIAAPASTPVPAPGK